VGQTYSPSIHDVPSQEKTTSNNLTASIQTKVMAEFVGYFVHKF